MKGSRLGSGGVDFDVTALFHHLSRSGYLRLPDKQWPPVTISRRLSLLTGYLVPAFIVALTVGISFGTNAHGYGDGEFCWLSSPAYIWAFAGPVLLVILANNIIVFYVISKAENTLPNELRRHQAQKNHKSSMMKMFTISSLLGCGWLFGVLQMELSPVFSYIFVLINGSQSSINL
ncbi:unnamed protein product [Darwinula stevensoni]|uniref:G-protein coupled receptors family 2 profile 2 domain-containing protein n=1 Tax=Darwinula stevensoni TaxID=69355 RepID=A0A7R9FNC3_9CRUS|nr:unnamed protein product [Darwinula stevensoni]CAG0896543.1 unnamed protein product [Darwinula stevensoni]